MQNLITVGTRVEVLDNLGAGPIRQGTVTDTNVRYDDFMFPAIVYKDDDGQERWCFERQILDIIG